MTAFGWGEWSYVPREEWVSWSSWRAGFKVGSCGRENATKRQAASVGTLKPNPPDLDLSLGPGEPWPVPEHDK